MKNYRIIALLVILFNLSACRRDKSRTFLPGTYISSAVGEFSKADDTLIVESSAENQFMLHRRTGFNRIENGKIGKREYETEEWRATYDPATKTLLENRKGKLITIYPDSGYLLIGKRKYQKDVR